MNLRDRCVEVHRRPIASERRWAEVRLARPGDRLDLVALPGPTIDVAEILPPA